MTGQRLWGIDSALKGLAITKLSDGEPEFIWFDSEKGAKSKDPWKRIFWMRSMLREEVQRAIQDKLAPDAVFVESVFVMGNRNNVIPLASTLAAVRLTFDDFSIPIFEVTASSWKREVVGNGTASKEMVQEFLRAANPDLPDMREDLWDSFAIALYGKQKLRKGAA